MKIFNLIIILSLTATQLNAQLNKPVPECGVPAKQKSDPEAEAIVDKHIAAIGGAAAFDSVKSLIKEGIQNYFGTVEALKITYEKDKLLRYDAEYNGQQGYWMVSKAEGGEYFPWETKSAAKFSKVYLQSMQGNLHPVDVLLNYKKDSTQLTLIGKDTINQRTCYRIKLLSKKRGTIRVYWIDDAAYMVQRMEKYYFFRNKSNDKLKAVDRFDYNDYRQVGNIKIPFAEKFKTVINKVAVGEKESLFSKIEINQPVNPMLYHINAGMEVTSSEYYYP